MNSKLMTRWQINFIGLSTMLLGGVAMAQSATGNSAQPAARSLSLRDGTRVSALGMGSWRLGQGRRPVEQEEEAMRVGLSLGMSVIDTAEMYGNGDSEAMIGRVIAGRRSQVFLVSKVLPSNATTARGIREACARSLKHLNTDYLDLYLLHWRAHVKDLALVVDTFEALKREGHIRRWGVSNFSVSDMEELYRVENGQQCATNQVSYSLADRSAERALIPWCRQNQLALMAYSPLGSDGRLLKNSTLIDVATKYAVSPAAVAIAWTLRNGSTLAIPESGSAAHIRENARAATLLLDEQDLAALDRAFPA